MEIDPVTIQQIVALLVTIVSALIAAWQNRKAAAAQAETQEVVAFFDPQSPVDIPPTVVPMRSYIASTDTRNAITRYHSPAEQAAILAQVDEAEAAGKIDYVVRYEGGYYHLVWGQISDAIWPQKVPGFA